jgi:hypothetical protein
MSGFIGFHSFFLPMVNFYKEGYQAIMEKLCRRKGFLWRCQLGTNWLINRKKYCQLAYALTMWSGFSDAEQ